MDPKEFYTRKAQQLSQLCDLLAEVQEISLQLTGSELKAPDPDVELRDELRHLYDKAVSFERYLADQYMAVAPLT